MAQKIVGSLKIGPGAELREADLQEADLQGADLQGADLREADLREADLQGANLQGAKLRGAKLRGADLQGADLRGAELRGADLRGADLRGANLDFSCWPLWCGSVGVKVDECLVSQLAYHLYQVDGPGVPRGALRELAEAFREAQPMAPELIAGSSR